MVVNLELYRIFVIVAQNKSITSASKELNISQPAVTKHIKNLEGMLKTQLFSRKNNGIELTKEGLEIYNEVKDAINILNNIEDRYGLSKTITLGSHSTMLNKIFSECLAKFYRQNDMTKIVTINSDIKEMLIKLKNKDIDIVLSKKTEIEEDKNKIKYIKLGTLNDVLVTRYNSELAKISFEELKSRSLFMPRATSETTTNFFESLNCAYSDFRSIKNITYSTMVKLIEATDGIGLVTKEFIEDELVANRLKILNTEFEIKPIEFGIYVSNDNKFKELNRFIEIVKEHFI